MLAAAHAAGVEVEVRPRPRARSLEESAAGLGITPGEIGKTLVVRRSGGAYILAVVPGDRSLAWPKLRAATGANRLSLPEADEALSATGYVRGTITPLGAGGWPVYVDSSLAGRTVALGSGSPDHAAFVAVDDLVASLGATLVDLT